MSYRATINGEVFFNTNSIDMALGLSSANLSLKVGTAGEFSFTVPPINKFYDNFHLLTDYIDVYRDDDIIFSGRVSSIGMNFDCSISIGAEGLLTVFNDTIFRPVTHEGNLYALVNAILTSHNAQVEAAKQVTIGSIDITDRPAYRAYENYESSYSRLDDLVSSFGGYLYVRRVNGALKLYWEEITLISEQTIDFGENILSIDKDSDKDDYITVLIPLGAQIENPNTGERSRLTISSVNNGTDYIELPNVTHKVVGVEIWDDVELASNLLTKGWEFLNKQSILKTRINVTTVDLADTGLDIEYFKIGKKIKATSRPHAIIEEIFECLSQNLNLLSPDSNRLTLGGTVDGFTIKAQKEALLNTRMIERVEKKYATNQRLNNIKTDVEQMVQENYTLIEQNSDRIDIIATQIGAIAKIFYDEPVPPYSEGDLWYRGVSFDKGSAIPQIAIPGYAVPGIGGDLFVCVVSKEEGEDFDYDDWKVTFRGQFDAIRTRVNRAQIAIDAAEANIALNAQHIDYVQNGLDTVNAQVSSALIEIDGLHSSIDLKVDKTNYNAAEIALMINNSGSAVKVQADHIALEGIVTANSYFKIKSDGSMDATNATVKGVITANTGKIGGENGWTIAANKLYSGTYGSSNSMYLGTANLGSATIADATLSTWRFTIGANFGVTNSGGLYAKGATISGSIEATLGSIGGWKIGTTTIYSQSDITSGVAGNRYHAGMDIYSTTSSHAFEVAYRAYDSSGAWVDANWTYPFYVTYAGALVATNATITGIIRANTGYIGGSSGWVIKANAIYNGTSSMTSTTTGMYVGINGIRNYISSDQYVNISGGCLDAKGVSIQGSVSATYGKIGGWTISNDRILKQYETSNGDVYKVKLYAPDSPIATDVAIEVTGGTVVTQDTSWHWFGEQTIVQEITRDPVTYEYIIEDVWYVVLEKIDGSRMSCRPEDAGSYDPRWPTKEKWSEVIASDTVTSYTRIYYDGQLESQDIWYLHLHQTSDINLKMDVEELDIDKAANFIYSQRPVSFKYINATDDIHHGLIAQYVEESALYDDWTIVSEGINGYKALNYIEIISDLIATVQQQNQRIAALEKEKIS